MFSHGGMTESPKPLSPASQMTTQPGHDSTAISRQRSPSLTTQFQQAHFGRRQSERSSPGGMSLPSPHVTSPHGPKLPGLSGLAPPESRYTLPSQVSTQPPSTNGAQAGQHGQPIHQGNPSNPMFQPPMGGSGPNRSAPNATHHQGSGSGDSSNNLFASDRGLWAYIQSLEEKVRQLADRVAVMENTERNQEAKINSLSDELHALRNANNQNRPQNAPGFGHMQQ